MGQRFDPSQGGDRPRPDGRTGRDGTSGRDSSSARGGRGGSSSARGGRGGSAGSGPERRSAPPSGRRSGGGRDTDAERGAELTRPQRAPRRVEPPLPEDVTGAELDRAVRGELSSLVALNAEAVSRHLVMAGRLLDEDPETAYAHAVAARERAGRVAAVREATGLAAYVTGRYAEALAELRAARRISGDHGSLPVMADCERGLGRPERALALATSADVAKLDAAGRVEMTIVASGARRDLGQPDAAVLLLQGAELAATRRKPWSARLFYAYAEALLAAGRDAEAREWFGHSVDADDVGETDADERLAELDGVTFLSGEGDEGAEEADVAPEPTGG